eukprot:TRINITY_DN35424_c0_g1_i1.p1 TRINITY_DN35424_c0_g1~~TRINITY_DN35424_c0_g1_i1.p1  ORF type:complete len:569 (+),score=166.74 TRINITY_DN35424_c0_g1_i1:84-1790(+)
MESSKRVGHWVVRNVLGHGSFGEVRYCVNAETRQQAAAKICAKQTVSKGQGRRLLEREIATMKALDHPSVLLLYEVLETSTHFYLILEFAPGGELFDLIQDHKRFTDPVARDYFQQLMYGVKYCHAQGVVHRDLKPQNLLLTAQDRLKIADFGFSNFQGVDSCGQVAPAFRLQTQCGTPNYAAPEIFLGDGYDGFKTDIWSCGAILYVMLCGHVPFRPLPGVPGIRGVILAIVEGRYSIPPEISDGARDLIEGILVTTPEERADIAEIEEHPWFMDGGRADADRPRISVSDEDVRKSIRVSEEMLCSPVDADPLALCEMVGPPEDDDDDGPHAGIVDALPVRETGPTRGGYTGRPAAQEKPSSLAPDVQSYLGGAVPQVQYDQLGRVVKAGGAAVAARLLFATPEQRATAQLEAGKRTPHTFVRKHWNTPHWCFLCAKFIYGVGRQGCACTRCGCPVHQKCVDDAAKDTCCELFQAAGSPERLATDKQRRRRNTALQHQRPTPQPAGGGGIHLSPGSPSTAGSAASSPSPSPQKRPARPSFRAPPSCDPSAPGSLPPVSLQQQGSTLL